MRLCGHSETDCIDAAGELLPIRRRLDLPLIGDLPRAFGIDIANGDKLRPLFCRQCGVQSSMLLAEMTDADDCCS